MSLEIYFKPIHSIEFSKNSIGSVVDSHVNSFPEWESSDIVFLTIHENRGSSNEKSNEIDHYSIRNKLYNFNVNCFTYGNYQLQKERVHGCNGFKL